MPSCTESDGLVLRPDQEHVPKACTNEFIDLPVEVIGGAPPYRWTLPNAIDGFMFVTNGDEQPTAHLQGTFTQGQHLDVEITVESGDPNSCKKRTVQFPLDVFEKPAIEAATLAPACVGDGYSATLTATGGDSASYEWTSAEPLPAGLSLSPAGSITGLPTAAGVFDVNLELRDGHCVASPRRFSLTVKPLDECPSVATATLPAICAGVPYTAPPLSPKNGVPPYTWHATSTPPGLFFNEETQTLTGTPTGTGTLTVSVTDADAHTGTRSYDFTPRDTCFFAYVSSDGGPRRLHYSDIFLSNTVALPAELPEGAQVEDFRFSPDGTRIAFRAGTAAKLDLYLYEARSGNTSTTRIPFDCSASPGAGCSVVAYAWSADSAELAVALSGTSPTEDFISGVSVVDPQTPWEPLLPTDYRDQLTWVGSSLIAYAGARVVEGALPGEAAYIAGFADGVLLPIAGGDVLQQFPGGASDVSLRAAPPGIFIFYTGTSLVDYFDGVGNIVQYQNVWVSPSGKYVASFDAEQLSVYAAFDKDTPLAVSGDTACGTIVAWAEASETIVCSGATNSTNPDDWPLTNGAQLQSFQFIPDSGALIGKHIGVDLVGSGGVLAAQRRVLSASGKWLTLFFDDGEKGNGVVLNLSPPLPTRDRTQSFTLGQSGVELEFAPDERSFLRYDASGLSQTPVATGADSRPLASAAASERFPCQESPLDSPERWCGAPRILSHFTWSSDSKAVLFESDSGLLLSDLSFGSETPALPTQVSPSPLRCLENCTLQSYAFQPLRSRE